MNEQKPYAVAYDSSAWRELMRLPESVQLQIQAAVESLENNPRPSGCKKLEDQSGFYRIRAGSYRIIYNIQDAILVVVVVKIGDRKQVYKRK